MSLDLNNSFTFEVDNFGIDVASSKIVQDVLTALKQLATALNRSSDLSPEGGAVFSFKLTIIAQGDWA